MPVLHRAIQKQVKDFIIRNGLKPGDRLPTEEAIAQGIGTSRAAVREGLRALESLGVIEVRRGEGRYVRPFNFDAILGNLAYSLIFDNNALRDLLEVRRELEVRFADEAVEVLTADDLRYLHQQLAEMEQKVAAGESFLEQDLEIHRVLFQRLGNQLVPKLLEIFWTVFKNMGDSALFMAGEPRQALEMHRKVVAAAAARDSALLRESLDQHFSDIDQRLGGPRWRKHL